MTEAPVERNALLKNDDKYRAEQPVNQKSSCCRKTCTGIFVILLILGVFALGLITGLAISKDNIEVIEVDCDCYNT